MEHSNAENITDANVEGTPKLKEATHKLKAEALRRLELAEEAEQAESAAAQLPETTLVSETTEVLVS